MSDSVRPHRWQPTRLPHPWDSPGKNTGVGCHCLLQSLKVKSESEVAQSCPTPRDPMDCSLALIEKNSLIKNRATRYNFNLQYLVLELGSAPKIIKTSLLLLLLLLLSHCVRLCATP